MILAPHAINDDTGRDIPIIPMDTARPDRISTLGASLDAPLRSNLA
jgi:hypothetical protein